MLNLINDRCDCHDAVNPYGTASGELLATHRSGGGRAGNQCGTAIFEHAAWASDSCISKKRSCGGHADAGKQWATEAVKRSGGGHADAGNQWATDAVKRSGGGQADAGNQWAPDAVKRSGGGRRHLSDPGDGRRP